MENIYDVCQELHRSQVKGKLFRLLFNLNKNTRIKVKTPVGTTTSKDTGPIVAQGSAEAGIMSSVSLDNGVDVTFVNKEDEVVYHDLVLGPLLFMDDIFWMAEDVASAQKANNLLEEMVGKKSLELNFDKSNFMLVGNKKSRKIIMRQLEEKPLILGGVKMKEVNVTKYLGDYLAPNLEDSVHQTVIKRIGLANHAIYEIRSIVEDSRATTIGGINVGYSIWEQAVIPSLTYNSESWLNIPKKTMKLLNSTFNKFHQSIMRIGTGCPMVNYYWQTGSLKVEFIILQKKLLFCFHLANLPIHSLGREFYDLQASKNLGIVLECKEHLEKIGISDLTKINKYQWRKTVKRYIYDANKKSLLEAVKGYKKLNYEEFLSEPFNRKSYFYNQNLEAVRYRFRISSKMLDVKANFPSKYRTTGISCPSCKHMKKKTNNNVTQSPNNDSSIPAESLAFDDLRDNYDLSQDYQIVKYFKEVLSRRDQFEGVEDDED